MNSRQRRPRRRLGKCRMGSAGGQVSKRTVRSSTVASRGRNCGGLGGGTTVLNPLRQFQRMTYAQSHRHEIPRE